MVIISPSLLCNPGYVSVLNIIIYYTTYYNMCTYDEEIKQNIYVTIVRMSEVTKKIRIIKSNTYS